MRFFNRMLNNFYTKFCVMKELTINDLPASKMDEWWREHNDEYYHYLYRIDNIENGMYYYGIHSQRKDSGKTPENDGYMGSGVALLKAEKKYGIEKFTKTVLKTFSTRDEARLEEMKLVDESLVNDRNCYNMIIGGSGTPNTTGVGVYMNINNSNDIRSLSVDDPLVLTKQFVGVSIGKAIYKNKDNSSEIRSLLKTDPLVLSGQFIPINAGYAPFRNKNNTDDIRYLSTNDPLVTSGEFIGITKGVKQSEETILKRFGNKNGSWDTIWINNGIKTKKIKKSDEIPDGWKLGRADKSTEYININTKEHRWFKNNDIFDDIIWKPSILFINSKFINQRELINLYNDIGEWKAVAENLGISPKKLKRMRVYYEKLGFTFPRK